ncbi:IS200/IS605 family transposase [Sphaerisporangium rhizosphaerae]|uniref:IS200/IS605 family transposase n=1 Tax=Sphaerisporangium rhizosphaerae TaxID=2269375 RepID=A0ABW2P9T9_9ACTN
MTRQVRTSPGAAYDLGCRLVWCPKYRRPVVGGRVKAAEHGRPIVALEVMPGRGWLLVKLYPNTTPSFVTDRFKGFIPYHLRVRFAHLRSRLPTLWSRWSRSYVVATAGAVPAEMVRCYIQTQDERIPKQESRA